MNVQSPARGHATWASWKRPRRITLAMSTPRGDPATVGPPGSRAELTKTPRLMRRGAAYIPTSRT
eukprot:2110518-Pyramimonas_sp.AAC.1